MSSSMSSRILDVSVNLGEAAHGRDNNFNLIRFIAATAVLFSHAFVILTGDAKNEPLFGWLGITPGYIAVDIFFVTSGFLVAGSLLNNNSLRNFVIARVLRIYPAMFVCTFFSIFIVGLYFTKLNITDYLMHEKTLIFLWKNTTILFGITGNLPDVFSSVPLSGAGLNASLWTLPFELRAYIILALVWLFAVVVRMLIKFDFFNIIILLILLMSMVLHLKVYLNEGLVDARFRLLFMFFSGVFFYIHRNKIYINKYLTICMLTLIMTASFDKTLFYVAYNFAVAYLVFSAAYLPNGIVRKFNSFGDISYGIYIYAFPVQQSIIQFYPDVSLHAHLLISFIIVLLLSSLSWVYIEKPSIKYGKNLVFNRNG